MDNILAIGIGLGLRALVDKVTHQDLRVGGTLVGLWEGVVLHHFIHKRPRSSDPYVALVFRLAVDYFFTSSFTRLALVLLWTGVGTILADLGDVLWYDKGWRRRYHRLRRRLPYPFRSLRIPVARRPLLQRDPDSASTRVRFYELPGPSALSSDITPSLLSGQTGQTDDVTPTASSGTERASSRKRARADPVVDTPVIVVHAPAPRRRATNEPLPGSWSDTETASRVSSVPPPEIPTIPDALDDVPISSDLESEDGRLTETNDDGLSELGERWEYVLRNAAPDDPRIREIQGEDDDFDDIYEDGLRTPTSAAPVMLPPRFDRIPPALNPTGDFAAFLNNPPQPTPTIMPPVADIPDMTLGPDRSSLPPLPRTDTQVLDAVESQPLPTVHELPEIPGTTPTPAAATVTDPMARLRPVRGVLGPMSPASTDDADAASVVSGGSRNELMTRADALRKQADEAERERARLNTERRQAVQEKKPWEAFVLKVQVDEVGESAKKLHERAEKRYYRAHNLSAAPRTIDVHRLKVQEAIRRTEVALREAYEQGSIELRVIVGRGKHSQGGVPVLKMAVLGAMQNHKIDANVNPTNPGEILIPIPTRPSAPAPTVSS